MKSIRSVIMILVSGYCLLMAAAPQRVIPILQQISPDTLHEQASDLSRRLSVLEGMNIEHRLTKVESDIDAMSLQTRGTMGGVGVLLIEGVIRLGKKRKDDQA
jgi:hypothetical protein